MKIGGERLAAGVDLFQTGFGHDRLELVGNHHYASLERLGGGIGRSRGQGHFERVQNGQQFNQQILVGKGFIVLALARGALLVVVKVCG